MSKPKTGKQIKTINFDKYVLNALEVKAKQENTTVSNIVNTLIRQLIINDVEYYRELAKQHYLKFQEYQYLKEQSELKIEVKQ